MIRRFNYTGRRRIPRKAVAIDLAEDPDGVPRFDCQLALEEEGLPENAQVYVEAYSRFGLVRLPYGTPARPRPPESSRLPELKGTPMIRFRVKVVDERGEHGRILAVADGITPRDPELAEKNRMSLLPVEETDLGELVWRIDFDQDGPVLFVNQRIEGIRGAVAGEPAFRSLVLPAAMRQILGEILRQTSDPDPWSSSDDWQPNWLKFAMRFNSADPPAGDDVTDSEKLEWVDGAVGRFAEWMRAREAYGDLIASRGNGE